METNTNQDLVFDDSFFNDYAETMKKEQEKKGGGGFTRDYENIAYAGCEPGKNKIFRFLGIPPKANALQANISRRNWDPKEVIMSDVKSDDGKRFTLKLPVREDVASKNHIVHRLYDRINEVTWINKQKVFVNKAKFPELIEKSNKMGFTPEDGDISYKSANGLKGAKYIVYNVIDRHDDWCKENKHTKILANSINVDNSGRVWGKPGIKEFGFLDKLVDLIAKYKLPEDYDIAIKRIAGAKTSPWELRNASLYASKDLMEELKNDDGSLPNKDIIVIGPLTQEEKNYEKYDLDKFYGPTTYQTIQKRIGSIFKETDAALKSKFYDELVSLVEEEKKRFDEIYRNEEKETASKEAEKTNEEVNKSSEDAPHSEAPKRRATVGPVETGLSPEKIAALKGWSKLTEAQRLLIQDVILNSDGSVKDIKWVECEETSSLLACDCNVSSPENFESCPACGSSFV
jgi:hypothetical protein